MSRACRENVALAMGAHSYSQAKPLFESIDVCMKVTWIVNSRGRVASL